MTPADLRELSVSELLALRENIDRQLLAHRAELQAQLAQIGPMNGKPGAGRGTRVAPKYRHPTTGETWSGRGGVAGWLVREIAAGRTREDFLIEQPDRSSPRNGQRRK